MTGELNFCIWIISDRVRDCLDRKLDLVRLLSGCCRQIVGPICKCCPHVIAIGAPERNDDLRVSGMKDGCIETVSAIGSLQGRIDRPAN